MEKETMENELRELAEKFIYEGIDAELWGSNKEEFVKELLKRFILLDKAITKVGHEIPCELCDIESSCFDSITGKRNCPRGTIYFIEGKGER